MREMGVVLRYFGFLSVKKSSSSTFQDGRFCDMDDGIGFVVFFLMRSISSSLVMDSAVDSKVSITVVE